jgi:5-formyltetrahydrofolate cyclo-ligase
LRAECLALRDGLSAGFRQSAAEALSTHGATLGLAAGTQLAAYWPIRSEMDPRPLMQRLADHGVRLALPVILPDRVTMIFRAYQPGDSLDRASFGLSVPGPRADEIDPDALLVPLAGFDRRGHRLGYGAGHYDRALERLFAARPRRTIGLAFACQEVDAVPHEDHDRALDAILTEQGLIACGV